MKILSKPMSKKFGGFIMKKASKLLTLLMAFSMAISTAVPVMAENTTPNEQTNEAVIFEDDFTGSVPRWYNYNTMQNDKRILTINSKQFVWETQDYTGWFYENMAHVTTLNVAPFEFRMEKNTKPTDLSDYNMYALPYKLGDSFKVETSYDVEHFLQRATPTDGEYSVKTVVTNEEYALVYSIERDGLWVLDSTGTWNKKIESAGETRWDTVATVVGNVAEIVATYNETNYTVNFELPTLDVAGEEKRQVYYGSKVLEQTKDENGVETWQNYAVYNLTHSKISNIYDDYVLVDDMQSAKSFAEYDNLGAKDVETMACGLNRRLLLTDPSKEGAVIYRVPANTRLTDFNIVKLEQAGYQASVSFQLIGADGSYTDIPNQDQVRTDPAFYLEYAWTVGGFMYYYKANEALKEFIANGNYVGVRIWTGVGEKTPEDGLFPSFVYADMQYKLEEGTLEQENQPTVPHYKGDVIIDDDFTGDAVDWYRMRINLQDTYNDATKKYDGFMFLNTLSIATINPRLTKKFGNDDAHVLNANIKENYEFDMTYLSDTFFKDGNPNTTKNLSSYAQITNGRKLLKFTSERDGIWAYTSDNTWSNVIPVNLESGIMYNVKAVVSGDVADLYLSYTNKYGKSRVYKATYTMPDSGDLDNVTIGINYDADAQDPNYQTNASFALYNTKLTNIYNTEFAVDDCSTDVSWVTHDGNVERTAIEGGIYSGAPAQYDLIDYTQNGVITYLPNGYIRDFNFTRRLGGQNQGDIGMRIYDANGTQLDLSKGNQFLEEVGGFYNNGHLYFYKASDSFKEILANGNYTKIEIVLSAMKDSNFPANDIYPAILRASVAYDEFDDITVGEHVWQTNSLKGVVSFAVDFTKNTDGKLRILPVLASYDNTGVMVDVYISDVQEFVKGDNRAISIGPIKDSSNVKAFLWNADTMQPLCEAFVK